MSEGLTNQQEQKLEKYLKEISDIDLDFEEAIDKLRAQYFVKKNPFFKKLEEVYQSIDGFWSTAFKNMDIFVDVGTPEIDEVLEHITCVEVEYREEEVVAGIIKLHFSENNMFTNSVITRDLYVSRPSSKEDRSASILARVTPIDWKEGKKPEPSKEMNEDSHFFDWLTNPQSTSADHFIFEDFYPHAFDFYLGKNREAQDEFEEDDYEEGEGEEDEEDEEDEEEPHTKKVKV